MSSVDTSLGHQMASEIAEQPVALAGLLRQAAEIREVAAVIRRRAPRFALFAGRGTSDHAALYGKYLVEIGWGAPAGLVSPSAMTSTVRRVLEILPLQQLAWRLAVDRSTDPDRPRGLSKVTRTR